MRTAPGFPARPNTFPVRAWHDAEGRAGPPDRFQNGKDPTE